jgi:hypothetical protein
MYIGSVHFAVAGRDIFLILRKRAIFVHHPIASLALFLIGFNA